MKLLITIGYLTIEDARDRRTWSGTHHFLLKELERRVERIEVHFELDGKELDDKQHSILEHAARTCPVALSLREELVQEVTFTYH